MHIYCCIICTSTIVSWQIGLAQYLPLNILQYAQPPLQQIAHQQQTHIAQELPWDKRGGNVKERKEENVSKRKAMYRAMQYTLPNYLNIIYRYFHFHAFVFISVYSYVILRIVCRNYKIPIFHSFIKNNDLRYGLTIEICTIYLTFVFTVCRSITFLWFLQLFVSYRPCKRSCNKFQPCMVSLLSYIVRNCMGF